MVGFSVTPEVNVLFITADQWRGDCLGSAAHPVVRNPNLDRPAAGSSWRTQYEAKHSQTKFLTDRFLEWVDERGARRVRWFAHLSFLRPHPPFLAPAPYDTMFDPALVPAPVRAPTRAE